MMMEIAISLSCCAGWTLTPYGMKQVRACQRIPESQRNSHYGWRKQLWLEDGKWNVHLLDNSEWGIAREPV